MIREGKDNVVIDIIRAKMVPTGTDAKYKASAIGKVPKISAYSGNIEGRIKPSPRHARRGLLLFYFIPFHSPEVVSALSYQNQRLFFEFC